MSEEHPWRPLARSILIRRLRKHVFRPKQIYDLGAGTNIDAGSYQVLKDESVREVYVIDPALRLVGDCRSPKVVGLRSEEGAPLGLPAMMLQPGFTLHSTRHAGYTRAVTPTWESTLNLLQPPWIVWSSYELAEHLADAQWLEEHGYAVLEVTVPTVSKDWAILGAPTARYCATIGVACRKGTVTP